MPTISDHPLRYAMANELHARPFPRVAAPSRAIYLAFMSEGGDTRAHLIALLDRYGAPHPQPDATHYAGKIGKHHLKWESHTEFVTYTIFMDGTGNHAFDPKAFDVFPQDWLDAAPGPRVTSAIVQIEMQADDKQILRVAKDWFVPESLAISSAIEGEIVIAGDFRIDEAGHMRLAAFAREGTGQQRVGRVVQRLLEIETYKAMSMLGLDAARQQGRQLGQIDTKLTALLQQMCDADVQSEAVLEQLLLVSMELENAVAKSAYRFAATRAYEAIVNQRISVLREERFVGRQTFAEFMMRRFDPAMRTVDATQTRLQQMSDRAERASDLLRTQVDVARSAQNQQLLTSMDKRADLQLRLQRTVEGLSVVAISYYAVNLVLYAAGPLQKLIGWDKLHMAAIVTPVVLLLVWAVVRRIRSAHAS